MSTPVIRIDNLVFGYPGADRVCLDIPTFQADAGERVFLSGPSGCGKSTLLGILGGVLVPQSGHVSLLGHDWGALSPSKRDRLRVDHIGFVFQQFNLISYLSVSDNVCLPCLFSQRRRARALAAGSSLHAEAARLLGQLGIAPRLQQQPVTALSVGQQQRVAVARALLGRPEVILADEPTSSLDAENQADFLALLLRECIAANATLLFVSHDERMAHAFTRTVSLLDLNRASASQTEEAA